MKGSQSPLQPDDGQLDPRSQARVPSGNLTGTWLLWGRYLGILFSLFFFLPVVWSPADAESQPLPLPIAGLDVTNLPQSIGLELITNTATVVLKPEVPDGMEKMVTIASTLSTNKDHHILETNKSEPTLPSAGMDLKATHPIELSATEENKTDTNEVSIVQAQNRELAKARDYRLANNLVGAANILLHLLKQPLPDGVTRSVILELALVAQQDNQPLKALQVFAHFLDKYPTDIRVPEVTLRQGYIYRQIGANNMALNKFYTVMTRALNLGAERLDYYERLVLQAKHEIAETYYSQGNYGEAVDFLGRLLKLEDPAINRPQVHYKLIRCLWGLGKLPEMAVSAPKYLSSYPNTSEAPEVQFLLAKSLKQMGRVQDSLEQVRLLLKSQSSTASQNSDAWAYWQQRTGNEIANELYKEGDFLNALKVYEQLSRLNTDPGWQLPVWYQIGLVYERMHFPQKATEMYAQIGNREKELAAGPENPSLRTILDMARWRKDFLNWQVKAELATRDLTPAQRIPAAAVQAP